MLLSDRLETEGDFHSSMGELIYIVGPGKLQNELMAFFLAQQTGATCRTSPELGGVRGIDDEHADLPVLLLVDCQRRSVDTLLADIELCRQEKLSQALVALFNVDPSLCIEQESVALGVKGFFYENDPLDRLPKGVSAIFDGELWASREVMSRCILQHKGQKHIPQGDVVGLTPREVEILAMVAVGAKNEEIAEKLHISPHTVKTHIYNIFKKIDVPNRLQAALWAASHL
jgi:DNA-binding NarL/FixJ family response regulator